LAGVEVNFFDGVTVEAVGTFAAEFFARIEWVVDHGVRQVEEERPVSVFVYEFDGFFGVAFCEGVLDSGGFDDFFVSHEGQRWIAGFFSYAHVVAIWDAEVVVEAPAGGEEGRLVAKVPFSDAAGGVAPSFQDFGNCDFVGVEALFVNGEEDALAVGVLVHIEAFGVAAGHERGA